MRLKVGKCGFDLWKVQRAFEDLDGVLMAPTVRLLTFYDDDCQSVIGIIPWIL